MKLRIRIPSCLNNSGSFYSDSLQKKLALVQRHKQKLERLQNNFTVL